MTDQPPLSHDMPCGACTHAAHLLACERCGCNVPIPGTYPLIPKE